MIIDVLRDYARKAEADGVKLAPGRYFSIGIDAVERCIIGTMFHRRRLGESPCDAAARIPYEAVVAIIHGFDCGHVSGVKPEYLEMYEMGRQLNAEFVR